MIGFAIDAISQPYDEAGFSPFITFLFLSMSYISVVRAIEPKQSTSVALAGPTAPTFAPVTVTGHNMSVARIDCHPNGLPRVMTDDEALDRVKELLAEGGRVAWTRHALRRMEERDFTVSQVLNVLKRGTVVESACWDASCQNWRLGIQGLSAGELLTVQVALDVDRLMGKIVLVITAYIK